MMHIEKSKITFPSVYPIKVIGKADSDFKNFVFEVLKAFDNTLTKKNIALQYSKKGHYVSARVDFTPQSEEILKKAFSALKTSSRVQIVL